MYNTTKCCRVVAAVGIERENVQCFFFFFHSCFKSCVVRESWCVLSQFNGVCFFFYHKRKKKKVPKSSFGRCHFSVVSKRRITAAVRVGKKGCTKTCTFYTPAVPSRLVVLLQLSNELNVNFAFWTLNRSKHAKNFECFFLGMFCTSTGCAPFKE